VVTVACAGEVTWLSRLHISHLPLRASYAGGYDRTAFDQTMTTIWYHSHIHHVVCGRVAWLLYPSMVFRHKRLGSGMWRDVASLYAAVFSLLWLNVIPLHLLLDIGDGISILCWYSDILWVWVLFGISFQFIWAMVVTIHFVPPRWHRFRAIRAFAWRQHMPRCLNNAPFVPAVPLRAASKTRRSLTPAIRDSAFCRRTACAVRALRFAPLLYRRRAGITNLYHACRLYLQYRTIFPADAARLYLALPHSLLPVALRCRRLSPLPRCRHATAAVTCYRMPARLLLPCHCAYHTRSTFSAVRVCL